MTAFAPRSPSPAEVISAAMNVRLQDVHVALPGRVERFDATKQLVDVQPLLLVPLINEDGSETAVRLPVIPNVPVVFPRGSGFHLVFPLAAGDNVLIVFAERSLDLWKARGGEVNPVDQTYHSLAGAVCYPGMYPATNPVPSFPSNKLVVGKDGVNHSPAARKNDAVKVTLSLANLSSLATLLAPMLASSAPVTTTGVPATGTLDVTGTITAGSGNVEIAD